MTTARRILDREMGEDELLTAIVEAALFLGWRVHHDRRSDKALQQGSPGFPDLCLVLQEIASDLRLPAALAAARHAALADLRAAVEGLALVEASARTMIVAESVRIRVLRLIDKALAAETK